VEHLLSALDSPTAESRPVQPSTGPFEPVPRRYKPLSSAAKAALAAAGPDIQSLTVDSLRSALLAASDHTS